MTIHAITSRTEALGQGLGSGQTVQPLTLLADVRNMYVSGLETSSEKPRTGDVFSLPLPVPFASLSGLSLFFWTLNIEPQEGKIMRAYQHQLLPLKQEGPRTSYGSIWFGQVLKISQVLC